MKPAVIKKSKKDARERKVLLGLVDCYLKTGKPVGSNTLKEAGFEELSAATLRNYFAHLEEDGYLVQQHISGGRIPTNAAYRLYANEYMQERQISPHEESLLNGLRLNETREIAAYLQNAAELLSTLTHGAVFLSAPRFDNDYIIDLKLVSIDHSRCLCVIVTDFGVIRSELLQTDKKLSAFAVKRIESYFHWRLTGHDKPENFEKEEEVLAQKFYNELMVRYIVSYSNFSDEELLRTGFSKLLIYPDFQDSKALADSLALFENTQRIRLLIRECYKANDLKCWIGEELAPYSSLNPNCTVLAIPYLINQKVAGVVGILGPVRMPYIQLIGIMRTFSASISEALTRNIYKFKITFRQPHNDPCVLTEQSKLLLLEKK